MPNRVLVVEDSQTQALRLKIELARAGLAVELIDSGDRCLEAARALVPAAIILDVELPGIDGYSLCAMLKDDPVTAHIPVIILTQRDQTNDAITSLQAGADDYIPKDGFAEFNLLAALRHLGVL